MAVSELVIYIVSISRANDISFCWYMTRLFSFVSECDESLAAKKAAATLKQSMKDILRNKTGLLVVPHNEDLQFTVSRYTDTQVFAARHTNDLTPGKAIYIRLDAAQRGLGTGSCGPQTLPQYQLNGGTYHIAFWLKHVSRANQMHE